MQLESLPAMVQGVWSEDPKAQLDATSQFRKLLSIGEFTCVCPSRTNHCDLCAEPRCAVRCAERNPPIEEVISQGVIPRFVQFLQRGDVPQLQVCLGQCAHRQAFCWQAKQW